MGKQTPLYQQHLGMQAKMVDFGGWDMPIHYGSQIEEHHIVRKSAGMFDVSHMCVVDLHGERTREFLQYLLANDAARLKQPGKALYSCLLNEQGGVIDDLITYFMDESWFRMVVNAGTRDKDLAWIRQHAGQYDVEVSERNDLAMIAVQGPEAREKTHRVLPEVATSAEALIRFQACCVGEICIARTGYTGEDGYEIMLPVAQASAVWLKLSEAGVLPCGLGARDTLRLEAGMNLYGHDMDETTTPLVAGLNWTIAWEPKGRNFIGREAIEAQRQQGVPSKLVGLVLDGRGVLRDGQKVINQDGGEGIITSGSFSPTLGKAIALARVPNNTENSCSVEIRGKLLTATIVKPPFVRDGQSCLDL